MSTAVADSVAACANCGASLQGTYCSHCGQKVAPLNPTLGEFLHELVHEIAHVDGKIVTTLRLLITRPGFLSLEHFEGRRARYVAPIRLYLLLSVACFAVTAIAPETGFRLSCTSCPPEIRAEREREMGEALPHWAPRAMFVLVPLFAVLIAAAARRSGRNYPQHLYFSLHVHAAWFFAGAVSAAARMAPWPAFTRTVSGLASIYGVVYFVLAFRRAYDARLFRAVVRTAAVAGTYAIAVILTLIAIVFPAIMGR